MTDARDLALSPQREDTGEYVRVPREPTETMKEAATEITIDALDGRHTALNWEEAAEVWSAMLAAAPPAPTEGMERALPSREEIARVVAGELGRQDLWDDYTPDPDWDLTWAYVDQGEVDFGQVADAILALIEGRSA